MHNHLWKGKNMNKPIAILLTCVLITSLAGADPARDVLEASGIRGGLVVHVGCGGAETLVSTASLRPSESFLVHGLSRIPDHVAATRRHIQSPVSYTHLTLPTN